MDDEEIRKDATLALAGAEYVRDRLLSLLSAGPKNILSTYYAIKCRVKSEDSLVEKVKRKHKGDKSEYRASDATDIVGLRILTIYSEDLLLAALDYLNFVDFCQKSGIGFCPSGKRSNAVSEIIVYKSQADWAVYEKIKIYLESLKRSSVDDEDLRLEFKAATKDLPYSSIHIVTKFFSLHANKKKIVPVETQIRTVFEDAWNEIDHPMRYKGESTVGLRKRIADFKKDLDRCGERADQLKEEYDEELRRASPASEKPAPRMAMFQHFSVAPHSLLSTSRHAKEAFARVEHRYFEPLNARQINALLGSLGRFEEHYGRQPGVDPCLEYHVAMLRGLIHEKRARLLRSQGDLTKYRNEIVACLTYYQSLETNDVFKDDAFFLLRQSVCFDLDGGLDQALTRIRLAAARVPSDQRIVWNGLWAALISGHRGYLAWMKARQLANEFETSPKTTRSEGRRELMDEAVMAAVDSFVKIPESEQGRLERARACSNLVSYCWEMTARLDVPLEQVRELIGPGGPEFGAMAKHMEGGFDEFDAYRLDSICKAYDLAGDRGKASAFAQKLSVALAQRSANALPLDHRDELMYTVRKVAGGAGDRAI